MGWLLARDGKAYVVSAWVLESVPYVRVLAYRVDVDVEEATGQETHDEWAYTGPRRVSWCGPTGLPRSTVYDPSKTADLILDFALAPPKCRKPVYWCDRAFCADYRDGRRRLAVYKGDFLAGFIAGAFTSGRPGDTLPPTNT